MLNEYELGLRMESVMLQEDIASSKRPLTEEEAKLILEYPGLFEYIISQEIAKQVVGEHETIHTVFLCANGRLVENAQYTSFNLLVNDESGAGKDWVTDKTLKILPKEQIIKRTRISEKVLTYWHNPKFEPEWTWDGKVFYNEDISNGVLNSDVFKVMASSGSSATVLIKQFPTDIEIPGKPVMVITTASATPNPENIRRFTIVNLDTTTDQTKEILKRQIKCAKKGYNLEYSNPIIEAQKYLQRVKVRIPFDDKLDYLLENCISTDVVIMRTVFQRFMDWIKASCAFHQYQRETDETGFKLATGQDYDIARKALLKTTSNRNMIPLTKDQQKILNIMKDMPDNSTIEDITGKITFMAESWLRKQLNKLADYGFLKKDTLRQENSDKKILVYSYAGFFDIKIPTWEELQKLDNSNNKINGIIG